VKKRLDRGEYYKLYYNIDGVSYLIPPLKAEAKGNFSIIRVRRRK